MERLESCFFKSGLRNGKDMKTIIVLMTCFNRCEKTKRCIESLSRENKHPYNLEFVIVDDGSSDGTEEMLFFYSKKYIIHVIRGDGNLYYTGGMRKGMEYILASQQEFDYLLMVNDDVEFFEGFLDEMVEKSRKKDYAVIVGAIHNDIGALNYGAVKVRTKKSLKYRKLELHEQDVQADTFNGNCVLIPKEIFVKIGPMDEAYTHNWGEFDYGMMIVRAGYEIYTSGDYVGKCDDNLETYLDKKKTILQRLKDKESPKGAPFKQWFHYLHKNYGIAIAVLRCWTPYIKLLFGK